MPRLLEQVRSLVVAGRYVVSGHAVERLDERGILEWQVIDGLADAALLAERPDSTPHPSIELSQVLPDGTAVKVVWSVLKSADIAKLVTVHFFDR